MAKLPLISTVQEIQAAVPKLAPQELAKLREWLEDFCEHRLELSHRRGEGCPEDSGL